MGASKIINILLLVVWFLPVLFVFSVNIVVSGEKEISKEKSRCEDKKKFVRSLLSSIKFIESLSFLLNCFWVDNVLVFLGSVDLL